MGRYLITLGLVLVIIGVILQWAPWLLNWFGRLPGDIRIERGDTRIFIPITSMVILSILLSLLFMLLRR
jgi:hypothetical protein